MLNESVVGLRKISDFESKSLRRLISETVRYTRRANVTIQGYY